MSYHNRKVTIRFTAKEFAALTKLIDGRFGKSLSSYIRLALGVLSGIQNRTMLPGTADDTLENFNTRKIVLNLLADAALDSGKLMSYFGQVKPIHASQLKSKSSSFGRKKTAVESTT